MFLWCLCLFVDVILVHQPFIYFHYFLSSVTFSPSSLSFSHRLSICLFTVFLSILSLKYFYQRHTVLSEWCRFIVSLLHYKNKVSSCPFLPKSSIPSLFHNHLCISFTLNHMLIFSIITWSLLLYCFLCAETITDLFVSIWFTGTMHLFICSLSLPMSVLYVRSLLCWYFVLINLKKRKNRKTLDTEVQ